MKFFFPLKNVNHPLQVSPKILGNPLISKTNNLALNDFFFIKKVKNQMCKPIKSFFFFKIFLNFFKVFYDAIKNKYTMYSGLYSYFFEVSSILKNNLYLNNPIYFNSWFMSYFNFIFYLKNKINKNNNLEVKLTLLPLDKRRSYCYKIIKYYYLSKKNKKIKNFFFDTMLDNYLNFKNSKLYLNKIYIYKFFLNS